MTTATERHPEAVAAAAEALALIPGTTVAYPQSVAATVVAAAAPHIERAVRDQVAADIEAYADDNHQHVGRVVCLRDAGDRCDITAAYRHAARIARGQS